MTKPTIILGLMTTVVLLGTTDAGAQAASSAASVGFITVRVGAQPQRRTIHTSQSFSLYDETATVTSNQPIKHGPMFDISAGYRVRRPLAIAAGVSSFRSTGNSRVTASIPDPRFFDRPRTVTANTSGLDRSEIGVHVQAAWLVPVTDKIEVAVSAGPSFIRVRQQLTTTVTVPTGTQNITVAQEAQSATALGVNVGFDGTFMFTPRVGAGVFLRYAGGSVDLPAASDVKVGGFQTGLGVRVHF